MDISNIIDTDQLFELELRDPVTDEPLGIKFQLRSAGSRQAKALLRRHSDTNLEKLQKRKALKSHEIERQTLEKAASYIASWDWGPHNWNGERPELSIDMAVEILDEADWIYGQVTEAAEDIANFSKASVTLSPKPSE